MNPELAVLAERQGGVFSRADALACGYSQTQIRQRIRSGRWRALRRGQYTAIAIDDKQPPWLHGTGEHRLAITAALHSLAADVVLSHQSAIVAYGLPTWGLDLSRVHVTRHDAVGGRISPALVHHNARLPAGTIRLHEGRPVVTPARAIVEIACTAGFEPALVIADEALRTGLISRSDLEFALCDAETWPGSPAAKQVLAFCDGRCGSVGESRLRVLMARQGLPTPELQAAMTRAGESDPFAYVDFLFSSYVTVGEFDGLLKYGGGDPGALVREKVREDGIRELGYEVVRVIWDDLAHPVRTEQRFRRAFARSNAGRRTG